MRCLRKTRKTTVDSARLARSAQLGKRSSAGFLDRSDGVRAAATTKPARESALLPSWFAQTRPASSEPGCVRLRERDTRASFPPPPASVTRRFVFRLSACAPSTCVVRSPSHGGPVIQLGRLVSPSGSLMTSVTETLACTPARVTRERRSRRVCEPSSSGRRRVVSSTPRPFRRAFCATLLFQKERERNEDHATFVE